MGPLFHLFSSVFFCRHNFEVGAHPVPSIFTIYLPNWSTNVYGVSDIYPSLYDRCIAGNHIYFSKYEYADEFHVIISGKVSFLS